MIADGGASELRFFDAEGRHARTVGRQGEGPGEFIRLARLYRQSDSLVAFDARRSRLTVFDASDGEFQDTIATFALNETWIDNDVPGFSGPLFGRTSETLIRGDRIWVADNASYDILELDSGGRVVRSIRRLGARRPVTDANVRRYIGFVEKRYEGAPAELRDLRVSPYENQPPPATMPAFGRSGLFRSSTRMPWLLLDDEGRLWVQDYLAFPDEAPVWSVFDARGFLVAGVAVPLGFEITYVGSDTVVGRWRDALDIEHVQVYDLIRP